MGDVPIIDPYLERQKYKALKQIMIIEIMNSNPLVKITRNECYGSLPGLLSYRDQVTQNDLFANLQNNKPIHQQLALSQLIPISLTKEARGQIWHGYIEQTKCFKSSRSRDNRKESDDAITPDLMEMPWIIWPTLFNTMRNWVFANLIITPYFDKEFSLKNFKEGSKQALVAISQDLSQGNFEGLESFVTPDALGDLKRNFTALTVKQRMDLAVASEDIFFSFPYQIGVMFKNEGSQAEQILVEIVMCFHIFRGFEDHIKSHSNMNEAAGIKSVYTNMDRISVANYRFIRDFTKGVEGDWTVNLLNHFKPGEKLQKK
ncbi:unnamed protein product, partial [Meganyctiphanes norvegica]